jgi:hypothetical protein
MKFVAVVPTGPGFTRRAIVELSEYEYQALTGDTLVRLDTLKPGREVDIFAMRNALLDISKKGADISKKWADIKRLRATLRTFLDLTEDDAILQVLEKCGVPVVVEEPAKESSDADD